MDEKFSQGNGFAPSSKPFKIESEKKYILSTKITGLKGKPYCAYFGVVLQNNSKALGRRIKWINDFSGNEKSYSIVFKSPKECNSLRILYRVNIETPIQSDCHFVFPKLDEISVTPIASNEEEDYELPSQYILPKPTELTSEQEDVLEKNIIWIFGSARSGTSWLGGQLLSYHTKFINEPLIGRHLGHTQAGRVGSVRDIDFFSEDPHYFFSTRYKNTWAYYLRKLILNRIYAQVQTLSNKIVIKEPNGSVGADILSQCFSKSKIILVQRDCRDVIDSLIDARSKNSQFTKRFQTKPIPEKQRLHFIERKSNNLVKLMNILFRTYEQHDIKLKLMIKYEDLRNSTTDVLQKIYDFIDIKISKDELKNIINKFTFEKIPPDQRGSGKVKRSATPYKWKENFSSEEKEIMNKILVETLRKLGYD